MVSVGIAGLALAVAAAIVAAFAWAAAGEPRVARIRAALVAASALAAWMAVTGALAARGILADFARRPPPMMIVIIVALGLAIAAGLSPAGGRLARGLPFAALVGFHAFRLPLEVVMHGAATRGIMPPQMSFTGDNFDIVSGITAIVVAVAVWSARGPSRLLVWAWNSLGLALLTTIVIIAVASMPALHRFGTDPRHLNTWFAEFPYIWLPTVLAPGALFGHVVLTRRLLTVR